MEVWRAGSLPTTSALLESLANCEHGDASLNGDGVVALLLAALTSDGFRLEYGRDESRNLRGLAESSNGGDLDVTSLVMVAVCIICAGLASGLTQVRCKFWQNYPSLRNDISPTGTTIA